SNQADKNRDTPQGRHATALQPINNWYQQTWHTIEFSNNRSKRLLHKRISLNPLCFSSLRCFYFISFFFFLSNRRFRVIYLEKA
ncbi:hypothetical protein, partial [Arthrobacter sp. CAU 1506]|uniref:hypothetical protein n=1 Tax=Arthrobacter sp. CAU 1506 TaxID=2560052 RepID=UPI00197ABD9E